MEKETKYIKTFLISDKVNSKNWVLAADIAQHVDHFAILHLDKNNQVIDWKSLETSRVDPEEFRKEYNCEFLKKDKQS